MKGYVGLTPRWILMLFALSLAALLAACATSPGGGADVPGEWHTASDDSPERQRARTRLALASGYYENGQYEIALGELKKAMQIDASFPDAYNVGGMIYMALGDMALAESHFDRAIALNPRDAAAMHNVGWMLCERGRFDQAEARFEQALSVPAYGDQARTLMAQGICQARAGQVERAEATLMHAYELDAGNPITGYNLTLLLYQRGDLERARFYIRRLNNSELANAESLWLGIRVERRLGNQQAVQQLASQLRRRFPGSPEIMAYERGDFDG